MKSIRTMTIVALCSAFTALGTIAYVANRSNLVSYFSGDPKVCINCHTMNTHYATWQHSSHREFAACADCHLPSDPVNKLLAKARDGFNHSVGMTLGDYGNNLRITDHAADRIQAKDFSIAAHGSFFHAPEETLRGLGSAINKAQDARIKLRLILAKYNAGDYMVPDFSSKEKAQAVIGLPYDKLVAEKMQLFNGLRKEWVEQATEKGIFDPKSTEGLQFKTSYN